MATVTCITSPRRGRAETRFMQPKEPAMDTRSTHNLITIAIVEDRPVVVLGLERLLERDGYRICWKAATLDDARAGMDAELPDVVIIGSRRVLAFREEVTCISSQTEMLVLVDDA